MKPRWDATPKEIERAALARMAFHDPYLRALTHVWHSVKCHMAHEDQCAFGYGGWYGAQNLRWDAMNGWYEKLKGAIAHAESCGLTLDQFVAYERLERAMPPEKFDALLESIEREMEERG